MRGVHEKISCPLFGVVPQQMFHSISSTPLSQVGRAGRFGTKGLAITFVSSEKDSEVLNQVQERFDVDIKSLPDSIDSSLYMNT